MSSVAEQLRRARESRGWTVYEVAELTKIKTDHIRALESGDHRAFSAAVYVRGFVRTYASILKLDPAPLVADLEAELRQIPEFQDLAAAGPPSHRWIDFLMLQLSRLHLRSVLWTAAILLFLAIGLWGFRIWQRHAARDPLSSLGPGLYQSPGYTPSPALPLPTNAASAPRRSNP